MTTTILAAVALIGSLAPGAKPAFRAQTDYAQAMKQAAAEGKPMAVLIGAGDSFAKLLTDPALPESAAKLLQDRFVCVAVDVNTPTGADLAKQFQLTDGLVISSAGGAHQALRQSGTVSVADLAKHT
ncbi:MAG: thioredoxin family protein, partial [Gemmataceae bacterium]|nr:thioredoxin family protein [Gemmataceae bacterium]